MNPDEIRNLFNHHPPDENRAFLHEKVREIFTKAVVQVAEMLPGSRERALFVTTAQEAQMWANAALAIHHEDADKRGRAAYDAALAAGFSDAEARGEYGLSYSDPSVGPLVRAVRDQGGTQSSCDEARRD